MNKRGQQFMTRKFVTILLAVLIVVLIIAWVMTIYLNSQSKEQSQAKGTLQKVANVLRSLEEGETEKSNFTLMPNYLYF